MNGWIPPLVVASLALAVVPAGCGGEGGPGDRASASGSGITLTGQQPSGTESGGDTDGGETEGDSMSGNSGNNSGNSSPDSDEGSGTAGDSDSGPKFDIGNGGDVPANGCADGDGGGGGGSLSFSYIWIANTSEGTVSKIDTQTGVEEGRYRTSDAGSDSPSRTSVNQFGDVAVGNRNGGGGITKIAAIEERCNDTNGQAGVQTSIGAGDVHPFLADECALWSTPLPIADNGPRAIAWEGGEIDQATCTNTVPNPRLWVGYGGTNQEVYRLDGDTGAILDHITIPSTGGLIYGGAVNGEGDLWMVNRGANQLIHVDSESLAFQQYAIPNTPYGMGVDQNGDPWVVSYNGGAGADHVYRFDVATSTFVDAGGTGGYYRGMNLDREGRAWVAGNSPCRLAAFDAQTNALINDNITLPGCTTPVGVSIDIDGFVWVVDQNGTAFKVHPDNYNIELTVGGLNGPYTYSDMTGAGLDLVVNPPG